MSSFAMLEPLYAHGNWVWPLLAGLAWKARSNLRGSPMLAEQPVPPSLPRLSIIVPACNEVGTLGPALRKLLTSRYPDLEIIAINDRSTDGTGELIDDLARTDSRIVPVHISSLPEGWLGKVNALEQGRKRATGE